MLRVTSICHNRAFAADRLALDYDGRQRSRMRTSTLQGRELAVDLPRGTVLQHGDRLQAEDGTVVLVLAVAERLSLVECRTAQEQARAAYHLGNRHVALQIGIGFVAYQTDAVLDGMMKALGYPVQQVSAPFEPEPGAYRHHEWGVPRVECVSLSDEVLSG